MSIVCNFIFGTRERAWEHTACRLCTSSISRYWAIWNRRSYGKVCKDILNDCGLLQTTAVHPKPAQCVDERRIDADRTRKWTTPPLTPLGRHHSSDDQPLRWLEMDPGLLLSCGAVHVQEVRGLYIRLIVQTCGDRRSSRPSAAGPVLAVFLVATPSTSIPPSPACALAAPMASSPRSVGDVIVPKPEDPPAQAYQGLPSPLAKW